MLFEVATRPQKLDVTLGEYLQALYETFLEELGDEDLAEVATLAVVQQRLVDHRMVHLTH